MMDMPWYVIALWLLSSFGIIGAIYAAVYGLIARFGMGGAQLQFGRSWLAAFLGLPLGFGTFGLLASTAAERGMQGVGVAFAIGLVAMLVMTAVNVIVVRTKDGRGLTFIQAFFVQLLPNMALVLLTVATRPSP